jgi:hypothetical protein
MAKLLYVEADEEITDLVDRLRSLPSEGEIAFVVPERARSLQSPMSFRLLKRYAESFGKQVTVISREPRLQALSLESGFSAYPDLVAYHRGDQMMRPAEAETARWPPAPSIELAEPRAITPTAVVTAPAQPVREVSFSTGAAQGPRLPLTKPERGRSVNRRPYFIGLGLIGFLVLLLALFYVPSATAVISVAGTKVQTEVELAGSPNPQPGVADAFATQMISVSEQQQVQATASGQKQIAAVAATGSVILSNHWIATVIFPKGTIVSTPQGVRFSTTAISEQVPPGGSTQPIPIVAKNAGASGNVPANSITVLYPADSNVLYSVTNPAATSGGADARTATVLQQSDIDDQSQPVKDQLTQKVQDEFSSKAGSLHTLPSTPSVKVSADHKVGDEASSATITVAVTESAPAFDSQVVDKILKAELEKKVPASSQLTGDKLQTSFDVLSARPDGSVRLAFHVQGFAIPRLSESDIRAEIKGHTPGGAEARLQEIPKVVDVVIRQEPYPLPWLPFFSSKIHVQIQEASGSSTS